MISFLKFYVMNCSTIFQMTRTVVMMILTYPIVMLSRNSHSLSWTLKPNDEPPRKRRRPNKKATQLQQTLIRSISQTLFLLPGSNARIHQWLTMLLWCEYVISYIHIWNLLLEIYFLKIRTSLNWYLCFVMRRERAVNWTAWNIVTWSWLNSMLRLIISLFWLFINYI